MLRILTLYTFILICNSQSLSNGVNEVANSLVDLSSDLRALLNKVPVNRKSDYCFGNYTNGFNGFINHMTGLLPMSPNEMDVKFLLFTCNNRDNSQNLTYLSQPNEWTAAGFNISARTKFIVHGWLEKYPGGIQSDWYNWMEQMKNVILNNSCVNVVAIDWYKPASLSYLIQSVPNTKIVGQMIGCVINRLSANLGVDPQDIHLIGHSLGSHVVGFAGKHVTNPKVGHITADDPAGPGFIGQPPENRLAVGDASFVSVIHTNGIPINGLPVIQGQGYSEPLGNIDAYFNGDLKKRILCNHIRSNYYAITDQSDPQSTGCQPIAYKCDSYDNFLRGLCADGSDSLPMELDLNYWDNKSNWDTTDTNNKYYINTGNVLEP
ncbi:unnamed protein product, partial [Oppiella nova]